MLSIFRKTALVSAALSLALLGATAPASAQLRNSGGGGGFGGGAHGGFSGGGFNSGGMRAAPTFNSGGFNAGGFNSGAMRSTPMIENRSAFTNGGFAVNNSGNAAVSNFRPNGNPGGFAGGDWHHHHHHHFFGGFVPFAYYGGYPYYDSGYDNDYSYDDCTEYRPVYDRYGHYLGRRPVNVC
jgi:hypothetical protein